MASTNKTPNLSLSQYLGSDKFQRVDYNADMLKIDTAVKSAQDTADEAQAAVGSLTLDNVPDGDTRKLGDAQSIAGVPVNLDGLTEGQTLSYDGEKFAPADGGTGDATSIDGIPVSLDGMVDGQTLIMQGGELVPGSGGSDDIWLPSVSESGDLLWVRSASTTPPTSRNIKGPDGQDGAPGAKWYTSETSPTGTNTGDYWLSTAPTTLGNVYRFDGADWVLEANIKGQDGTGAGDMLWATWRAIYDPTASGKVSQAESADAVLWDGVDNVPAASAMQAGITQLSSAVDSTTEDKAATPKAVKAAYDEAVIKALPETVFNGVSSAALPTNGLYEFINIPSSLALTLGAPAEGVSNDWDLWIEVGSTIPSITFATFGGAAITWYTNNGTAPTYAANKGFAIVISERNGRYIGGYTPGVSL